MKKEEIIKHYNSKEEADKDSQKMVKQNYRWFTGWYTVRGFSVLYYKLSDS